MSVTLRPFSRLDGIIYGPVTSRRFGTSLGINVFPGTKKACSFECPYCQLGFSQDRKGEIAPESILAAPEAVESETRKVVTALKAVGRSLQCLTFSGNGEPTAHPRFPEIVTRLRRVRDESLPEARIVVLTNGAHLDQPGVVGALNECDEAVVKLDAGTEEMFRKVNEPRRELRLSDLVENIRKLHNVTIQAMFVSGRIDNTAEAEIEAWIGHLKTIRPRALQIYTLDRVPADSTLTPVSSERLRQIATKARASLSIEPQLILPD